MKISIVTLFPDMFAGPFDHSIIKRAQEKKLVEIRYIDLRDYGLGKHKVVDDKPYGGGVGMLLKVDVVEKAIAAAKDTTVAPNEEKVMLLSATGNTFTQQKAQAFSELKHIIFVCGHYEGFDERIKSFIDEEISIGDFITTGGEIPTMLMTDAIVRLVPGVLKGEATAHESFSLKDETSTLLEFPQYTTPAVYKNMKVPEVLTSGNHQAIATWRKEQAKILTKKQRPDLLNQKAI